MLASVAPLSGSFAKLLVQQYRKLTSLYFHVNYRQKVGARSERVR